MLNKKKNNKGFTLVELLVVIAIIGILAVVAVPALFKNIEKGKVAELESDISAIRSAALSYYADKGTYPNEVIAKASDDNATPVTTTGILKEIESLSNPFDSKYEIGDKTANSGKGIQPPNELVLTITTSKLSQDGYDKLVSDLGDENIASGSDKGVIKVKVIKGN